LVHDTRHENFSSSELQQRNAYPREEVYKGLIENIEYGEPSANGRLKLVHRAPGINTIYALRFTSAFNFISTQEDSFPFLNVKTLFIDYYR
jgi:hypothetical protein